MREIRASGLPKQRKSIGMGVSESRLKKTFILLILFLIVDFIVS